MHYENILRTVAVAAMFVLVSGGSQADWRKLDMPVYLDGLLTNGHAMWAIGGAAVQTSADGRNWALVRERADWGTFDVGARMSGFAVHDGLLWVLPGGRGLGVWNSTDGAVWNEVNLFPEWRVRDYFGTVVFQDAMWIIGGMRPGAEQKGNEPCGDLCDDVFYNDVWRSTDGVVWTQVTEHAPWVGRDRHTAFVFQGKLWVIGGRTAGEVAGAPLVNLKDVWFSEDGFNWTEVAANAPWPVRYGHQSVVYKERVWLLGGWRDTEMPYALNDVWSSTDGVNWALEMANAPWQPRFDHKCIVFDDKLWLMRGETPLNVFSDVWFYQEGGAVHSGDGDGDGRITLSELLRTIQFYNLSGYHCNSESEDGFAPSVDASAQDCPHHSADYNPQDWSITLQELLRVIQIYNTGSYYPCGIGEDGFCPAPASGGGGTSR